MRIRTDGDKAYRKDEIGNAAEFYDRNKTDSVGRACHEFPELVDGVLEVMEDESLTHEQRRQLAKTLSTKYLQFNFSSSGREDGLEAEVSIEH